MKINEFVPNSKIFDNMLPMGNTKKIDNETENGTSFLSSLKEQLDLANDKQLGADSLTESFIKGDSVDIHEVMVANEEAKMSLQMAVQVRNKLVEAFQEINRIQL